MNEKSATPAVEAPDDSDLLRRYCETGSEAAFAELVRRRIGLVYSVALRQTHGDRHRAEDVCQMVFNDLARKAASLVGRPVLAGWLYRSARFAAAGLVRAEQRRISREKEAHAMYQNDASEPMEWEKVRPVIDDAMSDIDEHDRDVVLLRYFDERPFADIGARLRLSENAARMRAERALDRLNAALAKRGITSTSAALGVALGQQAVAMAPANLAATVAGGALAQASAGSWLATFWGMSKLQVGIVGAIAVGGATGLIVQGRANAELRAEIAALQPQHRQRAALIEENGKLAAYAAEVEQFRRDDLELRKLAQDIDEVKQANEAALRASRERMAREAQVQDAQSEIDRLNREGNVLVGQFKQLTVQSKDATLTPEQRAAAEAAAKLKLEEIKAKQREVQAVKAAAQATNPGMTLRGYDPRETQSVQGQITARREQRAAADQASGTAPSVSAEERVSLHLPKADAVTLLSALEKMSGLSITRDPSLATVAGTADLHTIPVSKQEAASLISTMLTQQLNVVLETMPDGRVVAKRRPGL